MIDKLNFIYRHKQIINLKFMVMSKDYHQSSNNSNSSQNEGYTSNPDYPAPSYHDDGKEYAWQKEEREHGLSVEDFKTRYVWGGYRIDKD